MPFARRFFNQEEQTLLVKAIAEAEMNTSGEIRLHLESFCFGNEVKAARKVFARLGMHQTQEHNGVLIYVATMSHKIAIVGDQGIHEKLGTEFWQQMVERLITQFKANRKAEALAACILECGKQLGTFFPRREDDRNELSNTISY